LKEICNWAPSGEGCPDSDVKRSNFTIRRSNYNLFRYLRDLFDDTEKIHTIASNTLNNLKLFLKIYNSENNRILINDSDDIILLNNIYVKIDALISYYKDIHKNIKIRNVARILYYNFKNKKDKSNFDNSLKMLYKFIDILHDTIIDNPNKIDKVLLKYDSISDKIVPSEEYRHNMRLKYLKYKQKYIELKNNLLNH